MIFMIRSNICKCRLNSISRYWKKRDCKKNSRRRRTAQGNPGAQEAARPAEAIPEEDRGAAGEGECCQGPASDGATAQDRQLAKTLLGEGRKDRAKLLLRWALGWWHSELFVE